MTRPAKPRQRGTRAPVRSPIDRWREAAAIREEWLTEALSTAPADRPAAEAAISALYALVGRKPPDFTWVDSPAAAMDALPPTAPFRLSAAVAQAKAEWPVAVRLATLVSDLRDSMDERRRRRRPTGFWIRSRDYWNPEEQTAEEALEENVPLGDVLDRAFRDPLRATILDSLRTHVRTVLGNERGDLPWNGQHDAYWVAEYDVYRRLGLARYLTPDDRQLDLWAALARSCGWWWPYDDVCVVSERPAVIRAEPEPGRLHGERWLHDPDGPALRYRDGWGLHFWNGTRVPEWVITDPTADRISAEPNIEVRRCAVERIGWDAYIDQGCLSLVAAAPDPGNAGCELRLYEIPPVIARRASRLLLATNGSFERDGRRRRYGLNVPDHFDDPIAAAAWTYGLSAAQYATLARRT